MIRKILVAAALLAAPCRPRHSRPRCGRSAARRLDVVANGEVTRVPDIVQINAGVVTQAASATEAIRQNAARMEAVRAALRRAGIADRDIQTSSINLNPNYRYAENQPPAADRLSGDQPGQREVPRHRQ